MTNDTLQNKKNVLIICLVIAAVTALVYARVLGNGFVHYDDHLLIINNINVHGLSFENISWAFTEQFRGNWHPLTWLSLMLDYELFGPGPMGYHLTNSLFHIVNSLLLFLVFRKMTGDMWKSAFVAALFALHPMHVESVAWASERKDVLSTFFWILTISVYVRYTEKENKQRYILFFALFILGLMSKAMLVTLPFTLLLLDLWPLGRLSRDKPLAPVIIEKFPLFALTLVSSVVTFMTQQSSGAVADITNVTHGMRAANSVVSYATYLFKTVWPSGLAIFYPFPINNIQSWRIAGATLLIVIISAFTFKYIKKAPFLFTGWFWFLGVLVPVIGIIQVGNQTRADRYMYVPMIGLSIIAVWGASGLADKYTLRRPEKRQQLNKIMAAAAVAVLTVFALISFVQIGHWKSTITMFKHTLAVTKNNAHAHSNLGVAYGKIGEYEKAKENFIKAIAIAPKNHESHYNLGLANFNLGNPGEAIKNNKDALKIKPNYTDAHLNLGLIYGDMGEYDKAIARFMQVTSIDPLNAKAYFDLGLAYEHKGMEEEAVKYYLRALNADPKMEKAKERLKKFDTGS